MGVYVRLFFVFTEAFVVYYVICCLNIIFLLLILLMLVLCMDWDYAAFNNFGMKIWNIRIYFIYLSQMWKYATF